MRSIYLAGLQRFLEEVRRYYDNATWQLSMRLERSCMVKGVDAGLARSSARVLKYLVDGVS